MAQVSEIAAPMRSAPWTLSVNQVLSARKPRERSGPNSQGQGEPAASPRASRLRYAAGAANVSRCLAPS